MPSAAEENGSDDDSKKQPRRSTRAKQPTPPPPPPQANTNPQSSSGSPEASNAAGNNTKSKSPDDNSKKKKKRDPIVYRWVGKGEVQPDNSIVYTKLEIKVGGRAALIRTGDCALLCSGDLEESDLWGPDSPSVASKSSNNDENQIRREEHKKAVEREMNALASKPTAEENALYGPVNADLAEEEDLYASSCFNDDAINKLDPFVARIEKMWEHPPGDGPMAEQKRAKEAELLGKNYDERRSRMKIQARWFYKKSDIQGLTSHFVGVSRRDLIATMTPRELILGDQADDNEVSTILGKCRVVSRPPLPGSSKTNPGKGSKDKENEGDPEGSAPFDDDLPDGAYACRYGLTLHPPARAGAAGTVVFSPYDGKDPGLDLGDETGSTIAGSTASGAKSAKRALGDKEEKEENDNNKRRRTSAVSDSGLTSDAPSTIPDSRPASEFEKTGSESSDEEEIANETDTGDKGPQVTEGSQLHGSIHVGESHQAIVPPLDPKSATRCRGPQLVWSRDAATEENVDDYLMKAADILKAHMDKKGLELARNPSIEEFQKGIAFAAPKDPTPPPKEGEEEEEEEEKPRKVKIAFRECDIDKLLAKLHECEYDSDAALKVVGNDPAQFLTIWNIQQRELFNAGFRRYYGELRMIRKGVGKSKGHKDVVDYFYRFKIPDQFCRYKDRKRDQAKRILQMVEKRRLNEAMSQEDDGGSTVSNGAKKSRDLSKTAGGLPNSIGQVEKRRIMARELLSVIRDTIGPVQYLKLCRLLKEHQSNGGRKAATLIPELKRKAEALLGDYPELLDQFIAFLPKKHR